MGQNLVILIDIVEINKSALHMACTDWDLKTFSTVIQLPWANGRADEMGRMK